MNPKTDDSTEKKPSTIIASVDLWLDNYDDIFSDFDPRDYHERAISGDFVDELLRRSREQQRQEISFRLSVPKERRNREVEQIINDRLKEHFGALASRSKEKMKKSRKFGSLLLGAGALVYFGSIASEFRFPFMHTVRNIFEVFCWFSMWEGARQLFIEKDPHIEKSALYSSLANADYEFLSEEDLLASITKRAIRKGSRARITEEEEPAEGQPAAPAAPEPAPQETAKPAEAPQPAKIVPRNHHEKSLFELLKKLVDKSSKNKNEEMEQTIHFAKTQIIEGKAIAKVLSECIAANPSQIRNSLEGMDRESEQAETLRKIAIAGFLRGIPEFRHLSNALASMGLLQEKDMRRCADPFVSKLEPEVRQKVIDDLPALLDLIKKAALVDAERIRPPQQLTANRPQAGPLAPGVAPIRKLS